MKIFAVVAIAGLGLACGYFSAGKWDDDPRNWSRAFHTTKAANVVVVHSRYWRSPHWTYEAGYLFEIAANENFLKVLIAANSMRQLKEDELTKFERPCFGDCPSWFVPGTFDEYDVWVGADDSRSHFRVFVDKRTRSIFLGGYQV